MIKTYSSNFLPEIINNSHKCCIYLIINTIENINKLYIFLNNYNLKIT